MKDSGIEWIGEIPDHWDIIPHKYVMHKEKDICEHYNGEDIISLTMGGVIVRDLTAGGKMPTTFDGYQYVNVDDLLLCLFDIDVTPRCVGVVKNEGITSPAYSRFKVHNGYHNRYYDYLLRFIDDEKVFVHLSKNLRSSLTETDFGAIKTLAPPIEEQKAIADFLDKQCAEIDSVIEQTKATIEEYKKLKQSVITEAVTKGIRGDRPMKDSGIEWIGEIPSEWSMQKMNRICSTITDYVASGSFASLAENVQYLDEPDYAMLIRTMDVSAKGYTGKPVYINKHAYDFLSNSNLFGGEIILPNIGASVGDIYIVPKLYERMSLAPNAIMIKTVISDKYVYYYYCGLPGRLSLLDIALSTAQPKFNKTDFRQLKIPVPEHEEQEEIVSYLDQKCSEIDTLIEKKTSLLEEMELLKKSIIFEYVTGKKKVLN